MRTAVKAERTPARAFGRTGPNYPALKSGRRNRCSRRREASRARAGDRSPGGEAHRQLIWGQPAKNRVSSPWGASIFRQTGPSQGSGFTPPEKTESFAMPSNQRLGLNHNQSLRQSHHRLRKLMSQRVESSARRGLVLRSNRASCLRRNRFSASTALRDRHAVSTNRRKSRSTRACPKQMLDRLQPAIQGTHNCSESHARTVVPSYFLRLFGVFAQHRLA